MKCNGKNSNGDVVLLKTENSVEGVAYGSRVLKMLSSCCTGRVILVSGERLW